MTTHTEAGTWPRVEATLNPDGTAEVSVGGTIQTVTATDPDAARPQVIAVIAEHAEQLGRPLNVNTHEPSGDWHIIIHPDGHVTAVDQPPSRRLLESGREVTQFPTSSASGDTTKGPATQAVDKARQEAMITGPQPIAADDSQHSFLTPNRYNQPAQLGWRGAVNHLGLRLAPSKAEEDHRADTQAVSQHWPGPRTVVVVNQKGGSTKTPAVILLSDVFALWGGAGVCAWDNNQFQGTLGWRTEKGPHDATAKHMIADADRLLSVEAQSADLARFVHHQTEDRYDVLRSQPLDFNGDGRFTPREVARIRAVLAKYYRLIIVDTSNDPSDPAWQEVVAHADQIVVATTTLEDRAEAGRLLLRDLRNRGGHHADLANNAVVIVSQADQNAPKSEVDRIATGFSELVREVTRIPYDRAIVSGWLRWNTLQRATQRAWLRAAAAVARGL